MKYQALLLAFYCVSYLNASYAQLSEEMVDILTESGESKSRNLASRGESFRSELGEYFQDVSNGICSATSGHSESDLREIVSQVKENLDSQLLDEMGIGEYVFFADCGGRNAFVNAIYPNLKTDQTNDYGISRFVEFLITEVGILLLEPGVSGVTVFEFVGERLADFRDYPELATAFTNHIQAMRGFLGEITGCTISMEGKKFSCGEPQ